jgi:hypothetical protein
MPGDFSFSGPSIAVASFASDYMQIYIIHQGQVYKYVIYNIYRSSIKERNFIFYHNFFYANYNKHISIHKFKQQPMKLPDQDQTNSYLSLERKELVV